MRRRRKIVDDSESSDRWAVSYADLLTLLFAFFVVMYAISSLNLEKYKDLTGALDSAFGAGKGHGTGIRVAPEELENKLGSLRKKIQFRLSKLQINNEVFLIHEVDRLKIEIEADLLFARGGTQLQPVGIDTLQAIAETIQGLPNYFQVEGYTDNRPINSEEFLSNWELSAVRAATIVRSLEEFGIPSKKLQAVGMADNYPKADNRTSSGRAQNRRVSIVVLSEDKSNQVSQRQKMKFRRFNIIQSIDKKKHIPVTPMINPDAGRELFLHEEEAPEVKKPVSEEQRTPVSSIKRIEREDGTVVFTRKRR